MSGLNTPAAALSPRDDRLAVIANLLAAGTLLLALVAGIVALAAYSAATGLPSLTASVGYPATLSDKCTS